MKIPILEPNYLLKTTKSLTTSGAFVLLACSELSQSLKILRPQDMKQCLAGDTASQVNAG
jgi:hypothetical protein